MLAIIGCTPDFISQVTIMGNINAGVLCELGEIRKTLSPRESFSLKTGEHIIVLFVNVCVVTIFRVIIRVQNLRRVSVRYLYIPKMTCVLDICCRSRPPRTELFGNRKGRLLYIRWRIENVIAGVILFCPRGIPESWRYI